MAESTHTVYGDTRPSVTLVARGNRLYGRCGLLMALAGVIIVPISVIALTDLQDAFGQRED